MGGRLGAAAPVGPDLSRLRTGVSTLILGSAGALVAGAVIVAQPEMLRLLCAGAITLFLAMLVLARPRLGIAATLSFLVVLALVRRVLIADAGWGQFDPLLLVGPCIAALMLVQLFVLERRPLATDRMSQLVMAVLGLSVLQMVNPAGGGLAPSLGGLLFVGVPLLWFFIGREYGSERLIRTVLEIVLVLGVAVGLYGLLQTQIGFPSWDQNWFEVSGYVSLNVGDTVRAFGTFSSSAEYALFLGSSLAVAAAFAVQGRPVAVLAIPPLAVALFLSSSRGALVTAFFAVVVMLALQTKRASTALGVTLVALALTFGALQAFGSGLSSDANNSGNDLISHQVGGVTDPLNSDSSTLITHVEMVVTGIKEGIRRPLGSGTGSTNQAGSKLGGNSSGGGATEVDISNAFVALGLLGGLLYLALVVLTLVRAVRGYFAGTELLLPVIGLLVVGLGQWLTGGHYALAPTTWVLIGWVAAVTAAGYRTTVKA